MGNKFYSDEQEVNRSHCLEVEKGKLYEKYDKIISIFQNKTDFTINKNPHKNNIFELNIIDPTKFDEIETIAKEVDNC